MLETRVGLDAGGTFTDLVAFDPGRGRTSALKAAGDEPLVDALRRCRALLPGDVEPMVVAGTTRVTNAVLEGRFASIALLTTAGFADVLAIGRQNRDDLYDLSRPARVPPLVPPELRLEVSERLGPDGAAIVPLTDAEVERVAARVRACGAEAVAVCLLHAYANPAHEQRIAAALPPRLPVSLSHRVSRERREFERTSTTALNAAMLGEINRYLRDHEEAVAASIPGAATFVVHSAGGMMSVARARALPLATVMSGPAAGVAATARLARRLGLERAVAIDMGGTSTDVCLLRDGLPATARDRRLGGHAVRLPSVAVESVGAGGGSIAWVDDVGALRIGPRSAGAAPGPAAYARGGIEATVTDANVVLGTAPDLDGGLTLDHGLATEALARVGAPLGLDAGAAAAAVVQVAHAELERALRLVTVRRGHDLRSCTLVAYGGAGPMHAGAVALAAGAEAVVVPALSSVFSAFGCCLSELALDDARTCLAPLDEAGLARATAALAELDAELRLELDAGSADVRATRSLELRYHSQNDVLEVAVEGGVTVAALRTAFDERHHAEYGYATGEPVEIVTVRTRLWVDEGTGWATPPPAGEGAGDLGETVFGPVLARSRLEPGRRVAGPAVLADELSTVVVWPGQTARRDEDGNVWLERA